MLSLLILLSRSPTLSNLTAKLSSLFSSSSLSSLVSVGLLKLQEVEKSLNDVQADDVKVILVRDQCKWTDFMIISTGHSTWHVKNIAQALIHKVKQKQFGSERMLLPSVEGQEQGNWIVVDSGTVIVHALDEKARAYYNLENLWMGERGISKESNQDNGKDIMKIRRKNNSKKPMKLTK